MSSIWEECKKDLKKRINTHLYDIWIDPIHFVSDEGDRITLSVPNSYYIEKINSNYLSLINEIYELIARKNIKIQFITNLEQGGGKKEPETSAQPVPKKMIVNPSSGINGRYRFENFIVGSCNQFAHAASKAVGENPGTTYNPLFLYGGVGLGKTHLSHAIGNCVAEKRPELKIIYVSSETFINDLITSLQRDRMTRFREKYRSTDVLMVDDIHFLAGKERSQEEFFHTFNTLFELKKQIVISSDKFPREIPKLEERLRSRFEWGLIADIQPPEFETKVAILHKKAEESRVDLPRDVAEYIASRIKTNVRELEGSLSRLVAISSLSGRELSLELAEETFKDIFQTREKGIEIVDIQKAACEFFGIKISEIKSKKRERGIAIPRQVAMFLCKELTHRSLSDIGKSFGGKDHTTVIHACRKIEKLRKENNEMAASIKHIKRSLEI